MFLINTNIENLWFILIKLQNYNNKIKPQPPQIYTYKVAYVFGADDDFRITYPPPFKYIFGVLGFILSLYYLAI